MARRCLYGGDGGCFHRQCFEAEEEGLDSNDYRWQFVPLSPPPTKKEKDKEKKNGKQ